jgi:hypothetical protein
MSEEEKDLVVDTLRDIHTKPEGEQLLMIMRIDRLVPFQPGFLNTTRELVAEYETWMASHKLPAGRMRRMP